MDAISERVHRLAVGLLAARDFPAFAQALVFHLREDFSVPHVALRVWGKGVSTDTPEGEAVNDAQRQAAETMGGPQCGPAADSPFLSWFGEVAPQLRSFALVPLGEKSQIGFLAVGSNDADRFHPGMSIDFLARLGDLVAGALKRY